MVSLEVGSQGASALPHHADDAIALAESVMTLDRGKLARADRPWEDGASIDFSAVGARE